MAKRKSYFKKRKSSKTPTIISILAILVTIIGGVIAYDKLPDFKDKEVNQKIEQLEITVEDADCAVHFIDVGQGDSALISFDGYNILIDAGERGKGDEVVQYLRSQGVNQIDLLVATHPHSDHIGGLEYVVENIPVKKILVNKLPNDMVPATKVYTDFLKSVQNKGLKLTASEVGQIYEFGKGKVTVLGPTNEFGDLNNTSIVLQFEYNEKMFLFTGDMEKESENDILKNKVDIKSDVLKVAHHGSNSSTTEKFLDAVNPQVAVISAGIDNKYEHPHPDVTKRLTQAGVEIYQTDYDKTVIALILEDDMYVSGSTE